MHLKATLLMCCFAILNQHGEEASPEPLLDRDELSRDARAKFDGLSPAEEISRTQAILAKNPGDERDWARLAWAQLAEKQFEAAERSAIAALRIRPYHARYNVLLARCLLANGKLDRVPLLLARAKQCNIPPYNQLHAYEIATLFGSIKDPQRSVISRALLVESDRNTYAVDVPRQSILEDAARVAPILSSHRDPFNKGRLWVLHDKHFVQVYDEELRAFDTKLLDKIPTDFRNATPVGLVITPVKVYVACRDGLLVYAPNDCSWSRIELPPDMAKHSITSLASHTDGVVEVIIDSGQVRQYDHTQQKWLPVQEPHAVVIPDEPGADAFIKARCDDRSPSKLAQAIAVRQWQELKEYLKRIPSDVKPEQAVVGGLISNTKTDASTVCVGMSFPAWRTTDFEPAAAQRALTELRGIKIDSVAVVTTGYQNDPFSTTIVADPEKTASPAAVERVVEIAHGQGLQVMLKVHVNLQVEEKDNYVWRGLIHPLTNAGAKAWFTSYENFLMPYVDCGIRQHVERMTVGVELKEMVIYEAHWRSLIAAIRTRGYTGKLTFAALHDDYDKVAFWDALDEIGIDAYFGLSNDDAPTLQALVDGWKSRAERLGTFSEKIGKPILFTELGFNNLIGASSRPWHWSTNTKDLDNVEQALCYQASLNVLPTQKWFAGMFIWTWDVGSSPQPDAPSYSPQNKLALLILESYLNKKQ